MTLSVVGAGLGRTGTASLKAALEKLGLGPCHHMSEVAADPDKQVPLWLNAAAGKPDWPAIFQGYKSAVDFPTAAFWRELAAFYPDAKIILSLRDPEKWYASTQETILNAEFSEMSKLTPFGPVVEEVVWKRFFDGEIHEHDHLVSKFNQHNDDVKKAIPADRLLVFDPKQGWDPLCAFLGCEIPSVDFPHVNSTDEMRPMFQAMADQMRAGMAGAEALGQFAREANDRFKVKE